MNQKTLLKVLSALLCAVLLAGCAAFAEDIPMDAPVPEVEYVIEAEPEDAGEQAVAAESMEAEAPAEPEDAGDQAVAAEPMAVQAQPMAAGFTFTANAATTLNLGEQISLIPDVDGLLFSNWKSSKPKVATVDENGLVTAVGKGKVKITAKTNNKKTYKLALTVVDPYEPTGVSIAEGKAGETSIIQPLQLNAKLEPATAQSDLIWSSSKPKVATVDANGLVTPLTKGKTKITVKVAKNKKKATFVLNVTNPYEPGGIKIAEGTSGEITTIQSLQLNAVLEPATAMSALTWKSSKPKVATVDANGFVTPVAEGTTKITVATDNKKKATFTLKVTDPYKPGAVSFAQGTAQTLTAGQTLQLNPVLEPATAIATLTWKSSKPKVATVDANGFVTAVGKGTAKITAQATNNKKAKAMITITVNAGEAPTPVVDAKDLSAWLDKSAAEAESTLGLTRGTDTDNTGTHYKLAGTGFYMYLSSADYASATISWVALEGQGKTDYNIRGFNTNGMTYDQAKEKAKADKWTIVTEMAPGPSTRSMVLNKNGMWLRIITKNSYADPEFKVTQVAYAHAN